ncbi:MAG: CpsD/CapB family tyrosine-protein kinase [Eubacteriales bacterium]|nr:CpsD/CapB family tyrosine-protein kinase [Eubacteriales bacterium]
MKKTVLTLPGEDNQLMQEAYKTLRTNLQFCGKDTKAILFTSCMENEGKTVSVLGVARSFAELGKKVLVIDTDMRKSVMAGRNTDAENVKGLSEILTGLAEVEECIYSTQFENFDLVFAGQYPPNPAELLGSKEFSELLKSMRSQYDYVLIDSTPLGMVIDAAIIAPICDGAVLVMRGTKVKHRLAQGVVDQLKMSGCKILGVVRNGVNAGGGYGYGKGYGYGYGYGYGAYGKQDGKKKK